MLPEEASTAWLHLSVGMMTAVVVFSVSVAAAYRDRGLAVHAAASLLGILAVLLVDKAPAPRWAPAVLLLLSAACLHLRELLRHLPRSKRLERSLAAASVLLIALAAAAAVRPGWLLPLGLVVWCVCMACVLVAARPRCTPWIWTAGLGLAQLGAGAAVSWVSTRHASSIAALLVGAWSCTLYMATVWRHRLLADVQLTIACNRFASVLSHDLRAPLQTISLSAAVLGDTRDLQAVSHRIQRATGRMQRMISDVLDLARIQNGGSLSVRREAVDLAALAGSVVEDYAARGIAADLECTAPAFVDGDHDRLTRLLENLLSNAWQHGDQAVPIQVVVGSTRKGVHLEVGNKGGPIPAALASRLFSPFKACSEAERNPGGLGLGLYIAQEIARSHGGSLAYEWREGRVVFRLLLPEQRAAAG